MDRWAAALTTAIVVFFACLAGWSVLEQHDPSAVWAVLVAVSAVDGWWARGLAARAAERRWWAAAKSRDIERWLLRRTDELAAEVGALDRVLEQLKHPRELMDFGIAQRADAQPDALLSWHQLEELSADAARAFAAKGALETVRLELQEARARATEAEDEARALVHRPLRFVAAALAARIRKGVRRG